MSREISKISIEIKINLTISHSFLILQLFTANIKVTKYFLRNLKRISMFLWYKMEGGEWFSIRNEMKRINKIEGKSVAPF